MNAFQLRITQDDKRNMKNKIILKNLFRKNKTSPLLKIQEKDFHSQKRFGQKENLRRQDLNVCMYLLRTL